MCVFIASGYYILFVPTIYCENIESVAQVGWRADELSEVEQVFFSVLYLTSGFH